MEFAEIYIVRIRMPRSPSKISQPEITDRLFRQLGFAQNMYNLNTYVKLEEMALNTFLEK